MTFISIGSVTVQAVWIAVIAAALVTMILYRIVMKKKIGGWYSDLLFYYILIWKFSYILFNFDMFINTPISALYFSGGAKGHILAIVAVSGLYFFQMFKKKENSMVEAMAVFLLYFSTYKSILLVIEWDYLFFAVHVVFLVVYLMTLFVQKEKMTGQFFLAFYMVEFLLLSIGQTIFTLEGFTFSWFGILGIVLFNIRLRGKRESV